MKEILRRARCLLVYLPPYSPQLNPIERCWVAVKCKVRQWLDRGMDLLQAVRQAFVEYIILRVYRYKYKHKIIPRAIFAGKTRHKCELQKL